METGLYITHSHSDRPVVLGVKGFRLLGSKFLFTRDEFLAVNSIKERVKLFQVEFIVHKKEEDFVKGRLDFLDNSVKNTNIAIHYEIIPILRDMVSFILTLEDKSVIELKSYHIEARLQCAMFRYSEFREITQE